MRLLWCDLETTGLDPETDQVLEIGLEVTDEKLVPLDTLSLVIHRPFAAVDRMNDFVTKMHLRSGLIVDVIQSKTNEAMAQIAIKSFLVKNSGPEKYHMAGNSVHFDKRFLSEFYEDALEHVSHQILDVTSLRLALLMEDPATVNKIKGVLGEPRHRVQADIRRSQDEFRILRNVLLTPPQPLILPFIPYISKE